MDGCFRNDSIVNNKINRHVNNTINLKEENAGTNFAAHLLGSRHRGLKYQRFQCMRISYHHNEFDFGNKFVQKLTNISQLNTDS